MDNKRRIDTKMKLIDIHTHVAKSEANCLRIFSLSPGEALPADTKWVSYGLHPWHSESAVGFEHMANIEKNIEYPNTLSVGETGLDTLRGAPLQLQIELLEQHIMLSEKYQKPMLLHCVRACDKLLALRKKHRPKQSWIIHGFQGKATLAKQLVQAGFYLSFGAALLRSKTAQQSFIQLAPNAIFLETDDDKNLNLAALYTYAAALLQCPPEELIADIHRNFETVFARSAAELN